MKTEDGKTFILNLEEIILLRGILGGSLGSRAWESFSCSDMANTLKDEEEFNQRYFDFFVQLSREVDRVKTALESEDKAHELGG